MAGARKPEELSMSNEQEQSHGARGFYLMRGGSIFRLLVRLRLYGIENAYVGRRSRHDGADPYLPAERDPSAVSPQ